ncbi:hypothetical protein OROMI_031987 [Orobanche minor]
MEKSRSLSHCSSGSDFEGDRPNHQYTFNGPSNKSSHNDPETKRKRRIVRYNSFTNAECKVKSSVGRGSFKASVRGSFKWIKTKINYVRYTL